MINKLKNMLEEITKSTIIENNTLETRKEWIKIVDKNIKDLVHEHSITCYQNDLNKDEDIGGNDFMAEVYYKSTEKSMTKKIRIIVKSGVIKYDTRWG